MAADSPQRTLNLERRKLDLAAGKITLDPGSTKNDEGRVMYLPPEALAVLKDWEQKTKTIERERGIIIPHAFHRNGEPVRHFPYNLWHRASGPTNPA
jgi:integrase